MGLLDKMKAKLGPAKDKAVGLAKEHEEKIDHGLDKVARTVDQKTKGKYSEKIQSGTGRAKEGLHKFAGKDDGTGGTQGTDDTGTPPAPGAGGPPAG
ncbi:antitoxin [Streptomyces sp. B-S-A6]|uniref:Antitoxin n=2 Tax=Streptomyces cavernicola TaxID=3043613 RepID=A0ABT6S3B7_9ACTN|nr:antitoxin [Streptomyces sp. B-S-A6]MDI3402525.1 antitoxin [Streptomyces sp. B-S-A6]